MILENNVKGDWTASGKTFHFAVDTCENFAEYTGSTTCKTNDEVLPFID